MHRFLLSLPVLSLIFLGAQAFADPVLSLAVVDADGTLVGAFYPPGYAFNPGLVQSGVVPMVLDRRTFLMGFNVPLRRFTTRPVFYVQEHCEGTPLVDAKDGLFVARPGHTVYVYDPQDPPRRLRLRSSRYTHEAPCETFAPSAERTMWRYKPLFDLHTRYTPPFRLQAVR